MKAQAFVSDQPRQIALKEKVIGGLPDNGVLIQNAYTAVSIGTELYCRVHGAEPGHEPEFPRQTGYCSFTGQGVSAAGGEETRLSFGLLSDAQYCDRAPAGSRFYGESAKKLASCVEDLNARDLAFTSHLGDSIDAHVACLDRLSWRETTASCRPRHGRGAVNRSPRPLSGGGGRSRLQGRGGRR